MPGFLGGKLSFLLNFGLGSRIQPNKEVAAKKLKRKKLELKASFIVKSFKQHQDNLEKNSLLTGLFFVFS